MKRRDENLWIDAANIKLAKDLMAIAKLAMPDTYYATDRRVQHARRFLRSRGLLPRSEKRFLEDQ